MNTWKADLALVANTVIWGVTFVLVKDALRNISPVVYLVFRFSLAGLALLLIYRHKLESRSVRNGMICGLFLYLGYMFQTKGLEYTTPSKSAFYTSFSIPMVPLFASLVYRHVPRWMEVAGIVVASVGMLLLTTQGSQIVWDRGSLLSLACAVAYAAHIVAVGFFAERSSFETIATLQVLTAAALSALSFPLLETPRLHWTPAVIAAIVVTALLATALAFTIQAWAQRHTTATRTALIYTLEPVWAVITSWVFLGETLPRLSLFGGLLILAGVLLVEVKREKAAEHPLIRAVSPEI